jgi:predicted transposase/invertase (TIGR01784 family)
MTKFQSLKERDIRNNPLHRWLTYLDKSSPQELIEEVIKMDVAIEKAETKLRTVSQDEETRRIYELREKAMSDWTSGINHAKRERSQEIARNMIVDGEPIEKIIRYTNLTHEEVKNLR